MRFERYKQNLRYSDEWIYSYDTPVGRILGNNLIVDKHYSVTTSKHLSYAASQLGLNLIKNY